jgi:glycosyltransferase involved in cell wall biosynthesis
VRIVHLSTKHQALDIRIFFKECRTLAAAGHQVWFLANDPPGPAQDGVTFTAYHAPTSGFRPARIGRRLARAYRQAVALRGDVYHFHDPELIPVGVLLRQTGARVVYDVHEDTPREALSLGRERPWEARLNSWAWSLLEGVARRTLDAFVCATPAIARHFPTGKTVVVQNFPLPEEFELADADGRGPGDGLVYAGGLTAIRGVRDMVSALGRLPEELVPCLELAGEFADPEFRREMEALPGWGRVRWQGWRPRAVVRRLLTRARAGLVLLHPRPEYVDSLPTKLFEYMAAGLPVIASDFPLWRAIVTDAGCGLLVDPQDVEAVAAAMRFLLEQPEEAARMGQRGREAVAARYTWRTEGQKLVDLYERLGRARCA